MHLGRFLWRANPHDECAKSHVLHIYIHESSHLFKVNFIFYLSSVIFPFQPTNNQSVNTLTDRLTANLSVSLCSL